MTANRVRSDSSGMIFALASATLMMSQHTAAKALRDALFLSYFDVTDLPMAMVATGVFSLGVAIVMSRLLTRFGPSRVVPLVFALSASALLAERIAFTRFPHAAVVVLYLHVGGLGSLLISGYWSLVNERFDPHAAKRSIARAAAFSALGGVLGGLVAERTSAYLGMSALLFVLASLHACCAAGTFAVGAPAGGSRSSRPAERISGTSVVRQTPYLQMMAMLMAVVAVIETLLDYALKAEAEYRYASGDALIQFFAIFYTATGFASFVLQAGVGAKVLRRLGVAGAMMVTPSIVVILGVLATTAINLWSVMLVRATQLVTGNSLFRAGFELLYAPLPREAKRSSKAYVDVGGQRAGDILGGAFVLWLLTIVPTLSTNLVMATTAVLGVGAALIVFQLHGMYVRELGHSLQLGIVSMDDSTTLDMNSGGSAAGTIAVDRRELLARIRAAQDEARAAEAEAAKTLPRAPRPVSTGGDSRSRVVLERIRVLCGDDAFAVREVLMTRPEDPRLVPYALAHVGSSQAEAVRLFLRRVAPRAVGIMTDILLDPEVERAARREAAVALSTVTSERALQGLLHGIAAGTGAPVGMATARASGSDFAIRLACARAAVRVLDRSRQLRVAEAPVYAMVRAELAAGRSVLEGRKREADDAVDSVLLDVSAAARVPVGVELVFTLLALIHDRRLIASALRGLYASDANVSGTALEYLETILPEAERRLLLPVLSVHAGGTRPARAAAEVADELLRTAVAAEVDLEKLRRD